MKFKVRSKGVNLGEHTLEELVRRRNAGEFSGEEYVQLEGALDWQPLDLVVKQGYRTGLPTSPPLAKSGSGADKIIWGAILFVILAVFAMVTIFARVAYRAERAVNLSHRGQFPRTSPGAPVAASVHPIVWTTNSEPPSCRCHPAGPGISGPRVDRRLSTAGAAHDPDMRRGSAGRSLQLPGSPTTMAAPMPPIKFLSPMKATSWPPIPGAPIRWC
jgi:hypothetical protein